MSATIAILVYIVLTVAAAALLMYSAGTPEKWRKYSNEDFDPQTGCSPGHIVQGVMDESGFSPCQPSWTKGDARSLDQAAGAFMVVTVLTSLVAIIWSIVALIGCCCRSYLTASLPGIATFAFLFSVIPPALLISDVHGQEDQSIGESTITATCASVILFLAIALGSIAAKKKKDQMIIILPKRWEPPQAQQLQQLSSPRQPKPQAKPCAIPEPKPEPQEMPDMKTTKL